MWTGPRRKSDIRLHFLTAAVCQQQATAHAKKGIEGGGSVTTGGRGLDAFFFGYGRVWTTLVYLRKRPAGRQTGRPGGLIDRKARQKSDSAEARGESKARSFQVQKSGYPVVVRVQETRALE